LPGERPTIYLPGKTPAYFKFKEAERQIERVVDGGTETDVLVYKWAGRKTER
jgi:hypothetical protein